jgi:hypothetical protein
LRMRFYLARVLSRRQIKTSLRFTIVRFYWTC